VADTLNGGLRGMVPRMRRALEGFGPEVLTDDQLAALIADAVAEIIFYAPSWPHSLVVTDRDDTTNIPSEFEVTPELTIPEQTIVIAQASLSYLLQTLSMTKTSETIRDEGQEWSYSLSVNAIRDRIKYLIDLRDKALEQAADPMPVAWVNLLYERDRMVAAAVEPYTITAGG
jgi:hypothetical protein